MRLESLPSIISIDGGPGSGKTSRADLIAQKLAKEGIPYTVVSTDDDLLERDSRIGKAILDYHPCEFVTEVVRAFLRGRTGFLIEKGYNGKTGLRNAVKTFEIPTLGQGVVLVEGLKSTEAVLREVTRHRNGLQNTGFVLLGGNYDVISERRFLRDTQRKGLDSEEVVHRIHSQKGVLGTYTHDIQRMQDRFGIQCIDTTLGDLDHIDR